MCVAEGESVNIKSEVLRLNGVILRAQSRIAALRDSCTHPGAVGVHKANTGNYDPSCDSYWTEFKCPECGKFWQVNQ